MGNLTSLISFIYVAFGCATVLSGCESLTFISRSEWCARPTRGATVMATPVDLVFVHHTAMDFCTERASCAQAMQKIQNLHMDVRGWDDIGYNFLIGGDGLVYEGRGWDRDGAHTYKYNSRSVAFSLMGNFNTTIPNCEMITTLRNLIARGRKMGKIGANYGLYGHRDATVDNDCPGDEAYSIIKTWPRWHAQGDIERYIPPYRRT